MTRRARTVCAWAVVGTIALGFTGCLISYNPDDVELAPHDETARVTLVSPEPNEQVANFLEVHLTVDNITLVERWGEPNVEGEGYLRVYIDGNSITPDNEGIAFSDFAVDVSGLGASEQTPHLLVVETLNNDGTPYTGISTISSAWIKLPRSGGPPTGGNEGSGEGTGEGTGGEVTE